MSVSLDWSREGFARAAECLHGNELKIERLSWLKAQLEMIRSDVCFNFYAKR